MGNPDKKIVIMDEIQKVPELLDVVHALLESKPSPQFILTGSSARKTKQKGVDLLGDRAVIRSLYPFLASELGNRFNLEKSLEAGLIPLIFSSQDPEDSLNAYIDLLPEGRDPDGRPGEEYLKFREIPGSHEFFPWIYP